MKAYFLDTNIFLYAFGNEHHYRQPCREIMNLVSAEEIFGVVNTEILQEILYYCWRKKRQNDGAIIVDSLLKVIPLILPIEKEDVVLAMKILDYHKEIGPRDAIHAATMVHSNYKYILTADKHFAKIKGIQKVDPFDLR